ncbi:hypothetical protein E2C01_062569 [Portunus trituberculatus]|uniref:Uncharacterized protein n=1 Tax=Portunus trituberculatus TaxID=210409 RepID=A0A5B7HF17_PORTR|nr:hypothetical protein [Portunus trituberculatus]
MPSTSPNSITTIGITVSSLIIYITTSSSSITSTRPAGNTVSLTGDLTARCSRHIIAQIHDPEAGVYIISRFGLEY